jgi:23S rRNA (pseudouridine1915-N3)-methyltransferase
LLVSRRSLPKETELIRVIAVGKLKDWRIAGLIEEYAQRIRPFAQLEIVELRDEGPDREAEAMLRRLGSPAGHALTVALDERGEELASRALADLLGRHGSLDFLIGGPDGLGSAARARAARTIRLSALTLPHELARLVLMEQVYRGLTILRGSPYHRD